MKTVKKSKIKKKKLGLKTKSKIKLNKKQSKIPDLKLDANGLLPAIVQDAKTKEVLMLAYMNKASLKITLKEGRTCFYSRSRKCFWRKGETSGHIQRVKRVYYDCDKDTLLILVDQTGAACHTGKKSCFYRKII